MPKPRQLARLLQTQDIPTLAEIALASGADYKEALPEQEQHELWPCYDEVFGKRADYRLWRVVVRSSYLAEPDRKRWGSVRDIVIAGLSAEPVITWGTLAVLSGMLTGRRNPGLENHDLVELVNACDDRVNQSLAPITSAEKGCAAARALMLAAVENVRFRTSPDAYASPTLARQFLDRLQACLEEVNPEWKPGRAISFDALESESRPVVLYNKIELCVRIQRAMFVARGCLRNSFRAGTVQFDQETETLLARAAQFAFSAWRTARSIRIAEQQRLEGFPGWWSKYDMLKFLGDEMQGLHRTQQAIRDAGDYLTAAGLGHLVLRVMPGEVLDRNATRFRRIGKYLAFGIRQAGLEVDERFRQDKQSTRQPPSRPDPVAPDPYRLRLTWDQGHDDRWAPILRHYESLARSASPDEILDRLVHDADSASPPSRLTLRAGFLLCLKYGRIDQAARLLEGFGPIKEDLLRFVGSVERVLRTAPFGIDKDTHTRWRTTLRTCWAQLLETEGALLTPDEALTIHEMLSGRYVAMVHGAGPEAARRLAARHYGALSTPQLRSDLDRGGYGLARALGMTNPSSLPALAKAMSGSGLGAPVLASLVSISENRWSLVVASDKDVRWGMYPAKRDIMQEAADLKRTCSVWCGLGVPWSDGLIQLGQTLSEQSLDLKPDARWVMLAVEPELASLPWQDLIRRLALDRGDTRIVVSLVPGLGWTTQVWDRPTTDNNPGLRLRLATEECLVQGRDDQKNAASDGGREYLAELGKIREQMLTDQAALRDRFRSAAIVLGHGHRSEQEGFVSVVAPERPILLQDDDRREGWISISDYAVVVVHACFGGLAGGGFLGDLGGLPGLALQINCRLFCSPVAEVPATTAGMLHRHLVRAGGGRTFGEQYLRAISDDWKVGLYNLYGLATEPLM